MGKIFTFEEMAISTAWTGVRDCQVAGRVSCPIGLIQRASKVGTPVEIGINQLQNP